MRLVLASASPQRKALLADLGLDFDIVPADVDESELKGELPKDYVARVARLKADKVAGHRKGEVVVASDCIVAVGRKILQKPQTKEEACAMLKLQSGRRVKVLTSVVVVAADGEIFEDLSESWVKVKPLQKKEIEGYLADEEAWKGVSGAMKMMGARCAGFYPEVRGSVTGIIGLPLYETVKLLRRAGVQV